jgi:hypothetical protein
MFVCLVASGSGVDLFRERKVPVAVGWVLVVGLF